MDFPVTATGIMGYDPDAVDVLMARVKKQYEGEVHGLITAGVLGEVRFDLVPGGYQIPAVDAALARLSDTFELREQNQRLGALGKSVILNELAQLEIEIKRVIGLGAVGAFDYAKNGYKKRDVAKLLKVIARFEKLSEIDTFVVRNAALAKSYSGLDRDQVDDFLAVVTAAATRSRITV
jgi:DivIVA domain-containing protein